MILSCARVVRKPALSFGPSEARWVKNTLDRMTLEEKIGQMVVCPFSGYFFHGQSQEMKKLISLVVEGRIGGLILFGGDVYETAYLANSLQRAAGIPLLISSDLERGLGNQIDGATQFPPLMALGAMDSEEQAYIMGKVTAAEARAVGIHVTYAPVVDVNINPENPIINVRSFGEDPERVSRLAAAFIKGCQDNGLLATAKHFPGHGDTELDSHSQLPTVSGSRERLDRVELPPFRRAIQAGVSLIMSAHLEVPALDPTPHLPATLSPQILTDVLRHKYGFKGLIVTDAMDMGGVTNLYPPGEAALKAVQAGADMILKSPQPERVLAVLIQAVKEGNLSEKRVDLSVRRILEAKARLGLHKNKLVDVSALDKKIASPEHLHIARQMFENSITLVKNEKQIVPLSRKGKNMAVFSLSSDPGGYFAGRTFVEEMKERCPGVFSFYADAFTGEEFIREGMADCSQADLYVFALFSDRRARKGTVDLEERHIRIIQKAASSSTPVVVVSFGSPYFIRHFPQVDSYLCAYRRTREAQISAVRALFGEIDIRGRLPVSLPGLYPRGHGLTLSKN